MNIRLTILLVLVLFFSIPVFSQLNFSAGYTLGYVEPSVNNDFIDALNMSNSDWLSEENQMKQLKYLHGLIIGLRYRVGPAAVSGSWSSKYQISGFSGENLALAMVYRDLYYRLQSFSAGLEFFGGRFSFGGTLDLNYLRIRSEDFINPDRHDIVNEDALSSHFFIGYNLDGNDFLSFSIQPYIQVPWTKFNLDGLKEDWKIELPDGRDEMGDGFMNYGVRLIFQNGTYKN